MLRTVELNACEKNDCPDCGERRHLPPMQVPAATLLENLASAPAKEVRANNDLP